MSCTSRAYAVEDKLLWRCHVCNDLHYGERPPYLCPTCAARNAFVLSDSNEAMKMMGERGGSIDTKNEVVKTWEDFSEASSDYMLVEDSEMVWGLAEGVIQNQKNHGLKYCPCRLTAEDLEDDLKLVCPCRFEVQQSYMEQGECWCGLFVKR